MNYGSRFLVATSCALLFTNALSAEFIVRDVKSTGAIQNLADADALIGGAGIASETTTTRTFIDMLDADNPPSPDPVGRFSNDQSFPNDAPGVNDDDFAIHVTTNVIITSAGVYSFGLNSDDGTRLRIFDGTTTVDVVNDNFQHSPEDHLGTITFSSPGQYALDLIFFEHGGFAAVELWAAKGDFATFDDANGAFRLVGDVANGGLATAVSVVPEPASMVVLGLGTTLVPFFVSRRKVARV